MFSPKIIDRYIMKELSIPFGQSLLFLVVMMVFGQLLRLAEQFSSLGLSATAIVKAIIYSFAPALAVILPLSLLLAALLAFGRMAADGEVTALTAAGIPFYRILYGPLLIGIMVSGVSLGLSIWGEPWGIKSLQSMLSSAVKQSLSQGIQPGTFYNWLPGLMAYTDKKDSHNNTLEGFMFVDTRDPKQQISVYARRASILPVQDKPILLFKLSDGEVLISNQEQVSRISFEENTYQLYLSNLGRRGEGLFVNRQGMSLGELLHESENPKVWIRTRRSFMTAFHKKFALPIAAIIFVILGSILGSQRSRAGFGVGLIIGVVVVGIYYYLLRTGELSAHTGSIPTWLGMWFPNILYLACTIVLIVRRTISQKAL